MRLDGKRTLIVGGGGGLGRAMVARLSSAGASVAIADIDLDAARAAVSSIKAGLAIQVDVRSRSSVRDAFTTTREGLGGVDVLIYAVGVARHGHFTEVLDEDWSHVIAVNLTGAYYCFQEAAFEMVGRRNGSIIAIASVAAERHGSGTSVYSASKAGLRGLVRGIAVDLAADGVRANVIDPGPVSTDFVKAAHSPSFRKAYERSISMKRYAEPSEIAGAVVFLASDDASYATGSTITVDGGFSHAGVIT